MQFLQNQKSKVWDFAEGGPGHVSLSVSVVQRSEARIPPRPADASWF